MRHLPLLVPLLALSCAAPAQSFRPTATTGAGRAGQPAAAYEVRDDAGRVAQVNVWSQGAALGADGAVYVHVALEVQNVGAAAITLDTAAAALEAFDAAGAPLPPPRLARVLPEGPAERTVAPASASDVDLLFAAGSGLEQIASLRLRWALVQPSDRRYVQFTDFTRDAAAPAAVYAYLPVFGFYDLVWTGPRDRVVVVVPHRLHVRRVVVVPSRRWQR